MRISDEIARLFAERGHLNYGENITQLEHGLQCAYLARMEAAPDSLVLAALLHDVGHLLYGDGNAAEEGEDDLHENLGCRWLETYYGPEVTEPVRLHVAAKRYICAIDPDYVVGLSEASRISLGLQGGPMSGAEIEEFEQLPFYKEAVRLRMWDDEGKKDITVPGLDAYYGIAEALRKDAVTVAEA